jgi:hypothetical protein
LAKIKAGNDRDRSKLTSTGRPGSVRVGFLGFDPASCRAFAQGSDPWNSNIPSSCAALPTSRPQPPRP